MKLLAVCFLAAVLAPAAAMLDHKFNACKTATGDASVTIQAVDLTPDSPVPGSNITIAANVTLGKSTHDMTGGSIKVEIFVVNPAIIPTPAVFTQSNDVCPLATGANQCPFKAGPASAVFSILIPNGTPKITAYVKAITVAADGTETACALMAVDVA